MLYNPLELIITVVVWMIGIEWYWSYGVAVGVVILTYFIVVWRLKKIGVNIE